MLEKISRMQGGKKLLIRRIHLDRGTFDCTPFISHSPGRQSERTALPRPPSRRHARGEGGAPFGTRRRTFAHDSALGREGSFSLPKLESV